MTTRAEEITQFLQTAGWGAAQRSALAGDASNRRYERLTANTSARAVLMDAPPAQNPSCKPFVDIAAHLCSLGLSAPKVFHQDLSVGLLLIEDLGDALFAREMAARPLQTVPLYCAAVDVLLAIQKAPVPTGMSKMDPATMADMISPAFDWYASASGDVPAKETEEVTTAFEALFAAHLPAPDVLILRDFHAENLLWLPERAGPARVGLLDFQDAVVGHAGYDLVSLLQDARRDVSPRDAAAVKAYFVDKSQCDTASFERSYALLGAQRNLRILGIFARLCLQGGKPQYVDLIPRVYAHLMVNLDHPVLHAVAQPLRQMLPEPNPEFLTSLRDQCATHPRP